MNIDEGAAWGEEGVCQVPVRILVDLNSWDTVVKTLLYQDGEVGTSLGFPFITKWRALPFCCRLKWWDEAALKASRHVTCTVLDCLLQCECGWTQIPTHPVLDQGRDLGVHVASSLLLSLSILQGIPGSGREGCASRSHPDVLCGYGQRMQLWKAKTAGNTKVMHLSHNLGTIT